MSEVRSIIKQLKTQQQGQLGKLQVKSEAEIELLDNVNSYFRKRAEIENQYANALEKLNKAFINKKFKRTTTANQTPLTQADDVIIGATYAAFAAILSESDKQARSRGQIGEKLVADIADYMKDFSKTQTAGAKRNVEFASRYQQEIWTAYDELEKAKHMYEKTAKEAEAARKKYDETARKPGAGLSAIKNLVTGAASEERVEKHRSKWKALSRKLNDTRNDYLLALETVNTIQRAYYKDELPSLMRSLDGHFYNVYPSSLEKYVAMEDDYTTSLHTSVETVRAALRTVDRNKEADSFMREHQNLFQEPSTFYYEPSSGDDIAGLTVDDVTKVALGHRLGKLVGQEEEINSNLAQRERELAGCAQIADVYSSTPSFGNAAGPLEQRQEIENAIRLLNGANAKVVAQIQMLKNMGVQPIMPVQATTVTVAAVPAATTANAIALYDYDAKAEGEISLRNGDELVIVVPDSGGWVKVRNLISQATGLVPANYIKTTEASDGAGNAAVAANVAAIPPLVKAVSASSVLSSAKQVKALYDFNATDEGELSFKAGDTIEVLDTGGDFSEEAWWEGRLGRNGQTGQFPVVFTQGWQALATSAPNSAASSIGSLARVASVVAQNNRLSMLDTLSSRRSSTISSRPASSVPKKQRVRALFQYEATCEGELSMMVGDIITIINKNTGSDAWWEGEGPHGKGQFPVNYVEVVDDIPDVRSSMASTSARQSFMPQVKALYDYTAQASDEISFKVGDIIRLTDSSDADWWNGELNGQSGAFPANYVSAIDV